MLGTKFPFAKFISQNGSQKIRYDERGAPSSREARGEFEFRLCWGGLYNQYGLFSVKSSESQRRGQNRGHQWSCGQPASCRLVRLTPLRPPVHQQLENSAYLSKNSQPGPANPLAGRAVNLPAGKSVWHQENGEDSISDPILGGLV